MESMLILTCLVGQRSDTENQVQLSDGMRVFHSFRIRDVLGVEFQERRPVENREQWCPFLEEHVYELVRDKAWR